MEKYGFSIMGNGFRGCVSYKVEEVIKIFNKYKDDTELYELEQLHNITREEYEELMLLLKSETINGDYFPSSTYFFRYKGITKNGTRCKCGDPKGYTVNTYKDLLNELKTTEYYCSTHKNQKDSLFRKSVEVVYGGKK